jgi:hypothetical protein
MPSGSAPAAAGAGSPAQAALEQQKAKHLSVALQQYTQMSMLLRRGQPAKDGEMTALINRFNQSVGGRAGGWVGGLALLGGGRSWVRGWALNARDWGRACTRWCWCCLSVAEGRVVAAHPARLTCLPPPARPSACACLPACPCRCR